MFSFWFSLESAKGWEKERLVEDFLYAGLLKKDFGNLKDFRSLMFRLDRSSASAGKGLPGRDDRQVGKAASQPGPHPQANSAARAVT